VRNRALVFIDHSWEESEHESGLTTAGFLEPEEKSGLGQKFLSYMGNERTLQAVVEALLSLAAEISASHPETIGPPYSFHIITKGMAHGGDIIEEQFRRALAIIQSRATQPALNMSREMQARTA
jgi:hypothetical protein